MEINLVIGLQQIRNTILDYIIFAITQMGDEIFVLSLAVIFFWCVNKRFAYKFIVIFVFGQLFTGVLKSIFKRPRPYLQGADSVFTNTQGYSFPSGHTANIANISTSCSIFFHKNHPNRFKIVLIMGIVATFLVAFSRVYLGQHFPTDTLVGAVLGISIALLFSKLFNLFKEKEENLVFVLLPLSILLAIFLYKHSHEIAKLSAVLASVSIGYYLEKKLVSYNVKSTKILPSLIKILLGLAILFAIKQGLKLLGDNFFINYLRYFLIGIFASFVAPLAFKTLKI